MENWSCISDNSYVFFTLYAASVGFMGYRFVKEIVNSYNTHYYETYIDKGVQTDAWDNFSSISNQTASDSLSSLDTITPNSPLLEEAPIINVSTTQVEAIVGESNTITHVDVACQTVRSSVTHVDAACQVGSNTLTQFITPATLDPDLSTIFVEFALTDDIERLHLMAEILTNFCS